MTFSFRHNFRRKGNLLVQLIGLRAPSAEDGLARQSLTAAVALVPSGSQPVPAGPNWFQAIKSLTARCGNEQPHFEMPIIGAVFFVEEADPQ